MRLSCFSTLINQEFSVDPTRDWKKYTQQNLVLLYAVLENVLTKVVVCSMRMIVDENVSTTICLSVYLSSIFSLVIDSSSLLSL